MNVQTDKDFRLLVTELAMKKLRTSIFSKSTVRPRMSRDATIKLLDEMDSNLMKLKFSYLPQETMAESETVAAMFSGAKAIYEGYAEAIRNGMGDLPGSTLMWCFNIISGLKRRLANADSQPSHGVDIVAVKIRNITKNDKLFTTRCSAGPREFTIVTNLAGLKAGDTLAAALLPPATVGGTVSEAMFLGSSIIDTKAGTLLDPDEVDAKEADGILFNELKAL